MFNYIPRSEQTRPAMVAIWVLEEDAQIIHKPMINTYATDKSSKFMVSLPICCRYLCRNADNISISKEIMLPS